MKKEINVLSLDGGGIRGVLTAEILVKIEKRLQEMHNDKDFRLSDHFDYIAGTSTGGILTCLYVFPNEDGRSKYSAEDAAELYTNHGGKIFKKTFRWYLSLGGLLFKRYGVKNMEKLFKKYFKDVKIKESVVPFMVTSIDIKNRNIYLFKSYKEFRKENTFLSAARATSAASTYFKPLKLDDKCLIDGGFGINNPSISSVVECKKIFGKDVKINMLSIGTGPDERSYIYKKAKTWGVIAGANKMFNIVLTSMSDAANYQMTSLYDDNVDGIYCRIMPNVYKAKHKMDDGSKKNLALLKEAGIKSYEENKDIIEDYLERTSKI